MWREANEGAIHSQDLILIVDNGRGFADQPKQKYFVRSEIKYHSKDSRMLGGAQSGLYLLEDAVLNSNASLFFKNRKNGGGTVSIQFIKSSTDKLSVDESDHRYGYDCI